MVPFTSGALGFGAKLLAFQPGYITEMVPTFLKRIFHSAQFYTMAPRTGLEPVTYGLTVRRSTD